MRGNNGNNYTENEKAIILAAYIKNEGKKGNWLDQLSETIGRPKSNICRFARSRGLTCATRTTRVEHPCFICLTGTLNKRYCSKGCSIKGVAMTRTGVSLWKNREHPRGMLNKTHTPEQRILMSERLKNRWDDKGDKLNSKEYRQLLSDRMSKAATERIRLRPNSIYSRTHKGWAEFPGGKRYFLRSSWELRYANFLETCLKGGGIKSWTYEEDTFWFNKIKRGVRSYTPDFKVTYPNGDVEYHEVKGWMDKKSATKIKRMRIYYPKISLIVIGEKEMKNV